MLRIDVGCGNSVNKIADIAVNAGIAVVGIYPDI